MKFDLHTKISLLDIWKLKNYHSDTRICIFYFSKIVNYYTSQVFVRQFAQPIGKSAPAVGYISTIARICGKKQINNLMQSSASMAETTLSSKMVNIVHSAHWSYLVQQHQQTTTKTTKTMHFRNWNARDEDEIDGSTMKEIISINSIDDCVSLLFYSSTRLVHVSQIYIYIYVSI